jgi:hypothetical protein
MLGSEDGREEPEGLLEGNREGVLLGSVEGKAEPEGRMDGTEEGKSLGSVEGIDDPEGVGVRRGNTVPPDPSIGGS